MTMKSITIRRIDPALGQGSAYFHQWHLDSRQRHEAWPCTVFFWQPLWTDRGSPTILQNLNPSSLHAVIDSGKERLAFLPIGRTGESLALNWACREPPGQATYAEVLLFSEPSSVTEMHNYCSIDARRIKLKGTSNNYQFVAPPRIRYGVNSSVSPVISGGSGFLLSQEWHF